MVNVAPTDTQELVTAALEFSTDLRQGLAAAGPPRHIRRVDLVLVLAHLQVIGVLLNTHEQGVIHEVVLLHQLYVFSHNRHDASAVAITESEPDLLRVGREQVLIFDGSGGFNLGALGETVNHTTLQVEDA